MTVYAESNFVLEIALGQEQASAAEAILERAERGEFTLALPAFSLGEPFATIRRRSNQSQRLGHDLRMHLNELSRSGPHQGDVRQLQSISAVLESIERRELERLAATVRRLLSVAATIPMDATTCAEALLVMDRLGLDHQDAVVYASIHHHIGISNHRGPHYFVCKDKDFDIPQIQDELRSLRCELVTRFHEFPQQLA
jgi:predicted nucleic acid-binding protein